MKRPAILLEPVSAFLATTIFFSLTTVGEVLFAVATAAISIGVGILTAPKSPRFGRQSTERTATISSPVRPRFFVLGETRIGTHRTDSQKDSTGKLWRVLVISCEEIEGIRQIFVNNEPVTLDGSGYAQTPAKWLNNLRIISRSGTDSQTVVTELSSALPAVVTSDYRLRGMAYLAVEQTPVSINVASDTWPRGPTGEEVTVLVRGSKLYDPRTTTTVYSDNAVLAILHVLLHELGGALSLSDFELTSWEAAADVADIEDVSPDGSVQRRYRVSGIWEAPSGEGSAGNLRELVDDLLINCNGRIYRDPDNSGKIGIVLDLPALNATTFDASDVLAVQLGPAETLIAKRDAITATFPNEALGYADDTTPHFPSSVSAPQAIQNINLSFCPSRTQAYRIAKNRFLLAKSNTASITMNAAGLMTRESERVAFSTPYVPGTSYIVERWKAGPSDKPVVTLDCIETPSGYGTFDAATELTVEQLPAAVQNDGTAIADPIHCAGSSDAAGTVRVAWDAPDDTGLSAEIQWSETGDDAFNAGTTAFDASVRFTTFDASAATGNIDVRMRFKQLAGGATDWVTASNIDPDTLLLAPTAPTITGLPAGRDLEGQPNQTFTGNITWTASECVYKVRYFADVNVNPPTTQIGADIVATDGDDPVALSTGNLVLNAADTVFVRAQIENVSGQTTFSAVSSIAITDSGV